MEGDKVSCFLCSHHCRISNGKFGICNVRENKGGDLYTHAYGELVAQNIDPIEKKPFYHFLPGSKSFSIAAIGCNFQCGFCQNWQISSRGDMASLGFMFGVCEIYGWLFKGSIAWFLWKAFRLAMLPRYKNRFQVVADWLITLAFKRDTSKLV